MRIPLALVTTISILGCATAQSGGSGAEAATGGDCDGVWVVDVTNWLKEQANVRYLEASGEWVWLGYVSADGEKTYSISSASTYPAGKTPHLEVSSAREIWCSQRWKHSPPLEQANSPNFKVAIRCQTSGSS